MKRAIVLSLLLLVAAACAPIVPPPPPSVPPPVPGMAPAGARVFTVYFDWNRSWVHPSGMAILAQAAAVYKAGGIATVQVTGYADTSGSARHNLRLSKRRAYHVARILTRLGVPWNAMAISGAGETSLAVPTPDGVREPHNRRVTIVE